MDVVDAYPGTMVNLATLSSVLWLFTLLLVGRVVGQAIVMLRAPRWLPPMEQWQSGLLPYPVLLFGQAIVLVLMVSISIDFANGAGYWVEPHARLGFAALWWSYLYAGAMVLRYIVRKKPMMPIVFHTIVAAFQWTFGMYHVTLR